jgi:hypothetical protein
VVVSEEAGAHEDADDLGACLAGKWTRPVPQPLARSLAITALPRRSDLCSARASSAVPIDSVTAQGEACPAQMEAWMADVGRKQRGPARYQGYDTRYLARKYGITLEDARTIIKRTGRDRVKLNKSAKRLAEKRLKDNVAQSEIPDQ